MRFAEQFPGRLPTWLAAMALACLAAGCNPAPSAGAKTGENGKSGSAAYVPEVDPGVLEFEERQRRLAAARQDSLVDPRAECGGVPVAWSLSGDGTGLFALVSKPGESSNEVCRWQISGPPPPIFDRLAKTTVGLRAFLAAGPDAQRVLGASLKTQADGTLTDELWLVRDGSTGLHQLDYSQTKQLPQDLPADALEGRPVFFSADGRYVVLEAGMRGLVVIDTAAGTSRYAAYPGFGDVEVQNLSCGALPALDGKAYLYASQYATHVGTKQLPDGALAPSRADFCQVSILNLVTLEWERSARFDWVVNQLGSSDFRSKPWILLGSRAKLDTTESERMAQVMQFDPVQKLPLLLPLVGGEAWDEHGGIQLTMDGARLVYKNKLRQGVTRVEIASMKRSLEPRYYLADARLLVDSRAETVLLVQDDVVVRCDFSEQEAAAGDG